MDEWQRNEKLKYIRITHQQRKLAASATQADCIVLMCRM